MEIGLVKDLKLNNKKRRQGFAEEINDRVYHLLCRHVLRAIWQLCAWP